MELKGFEEQAGATRPFGTEHGAFKDRVTWGDRRRADADELGVTRQPFVLIVGGGQGGIGLAARLKRIGVPALVVDAHARPGDAWRKRYKSLCLHDPVWYDHLPYLPFPDHWPIYTPKDKMGDWLESYTKIMELDYWSSSPCKRATWDEQKKRVGGRGRAQRQDADRAAEASRARHRHVGLPGDPDVSGRRHVQGQAASFEPASPAARAVAGKRCVVVGSNNSAHDIAADLWEHGADVTMLQRSPTLVMRSDSLARNRPLYSEEALAKGITTEKADFTVASLPYALQPAASQPGTARIRQEDADFYARLEKAGFKLTFGEDESGIGTMYMRRGSGYYIDVGASDLIADGRDQARRRRRSTVSPRLASC